VIDINDLAGSCSGKKIAKTLQRQQAAVEETQESSNVLNKRTLQLEQQETL